MRVVNPYKVIRPVNISLMMLSCTQNGAKHISHPQPSPSPYAYTNKGPNINNPTRPLATPTNTGQTPKAIGV
jgi:hypothetical protein